MSEIPEPTPATDEAPKPETVSKFGEKFSRVFKEELACVKQRWTTVYRNRQKELAEREKALAKREKALAERGTPKDSPSTDNELVGLAFSGGGIRSATINMGIAQALHRRGVFDHVDYMSTVSGGGYLGSSISTAMREIPGDPEAPQGKGEFPYACIDPEKPAQVMAAGEPREVESKFLTWVRNNSNYMATGGFLDWPRIFGSLLRGILANFLVLLPLLLALAVGLVWFHGDMLAKWDADDYELTEITKTAAKAEVEAEELARLAGGGETWANRAMDTSDKADQIAKNAENLAAAQARKASKLFPWALAIGAAFILFVLIFPVFIRIFKVYQHGVREESSVKTRGQVETAFGILLALIFVAAAVELLPLLIRWFHKIETSGLRGLYTGAGSGAALAVFTVAGKVLSKLGGLRQKIVLLLVGLLGLVIPLVVALYVADDLIYFHPPKIEIEQAASKTPEEKIEEAAEQANRAAGLVKGFAQDKLPQYRVAPHAPMRFPKDFTDRQQLLEFGKQLFEFGFVRLMTGVLLIILGGGAAAFAVGRMKKSPPRRILTGVAIPLGALGGYVLLVGLSQILAAVSEEFGLKGRPDILVLALAAIVYLFCWLWIEINVTGMLGLYRDRLAAAYLIGLRKKTDKRGPIFVEPDLNLDELCGGTSDDEKKRRPGEHPEGAPFEAPRKSKAPYHIVNTALNLQGSKDPMLRDRGSDFFMFSKLYYGGHRTGYCETWRLEKVFPQMDLPTAMAISAAAASPNAGRATSKPLVALMTLLNVRLGYWVPHPGRLWDWLKEKPRTEPTLLDRWNWRVPPEALLREMNSGVNEEDKWVNLSDGGHMENLAVYELLRRRCKYIICGDGEADPTLTFGGLAILMRSARIDMGIEIEILLDDLRLGEDGKSHQHAALGKIKYPPLKQGDPLEEGYLLYIKSSFTGNEDETMQEYRAKSPDFPHESTADQFFDEGQFEAYRALGFHMADSLFEPFTSGSSKMDWSGFRLWFKKLQADLAPRLSAKRTQLQKQLRRIQKMLIQPEFHDYFYDLNPDLGPAPKAESEPGAGDEGKIGKPASLPEQMYLVGLQVTLMEDAFLNLNLDQPVNWKHPGNAGWRKLFTDWAQSDAFQTGYAFVVDRYSNRFQNFCERTLGLPAADWREQIDQAVEGA